MHRVGYMEQYGIKNPKEGIFLLIIIITPASMRVRLLTRFNRASAAIIVLLSIIICW